MAFSDLIWILLLFLLVQPIVGRRLLQIARRRVLERIEAKRNARVILLVHRTETISVLGLPLYRYIDIDDAEQVLRAIRETDPGKHIELVLHTPGGFALAAMQIARAVHAWPGDVTVFVPHYAMSGGTLIALAADRIVMSEHAVLGPVDPQINGYPAASILSVLERKAMNDIDDETLMLADISQKAITELRIGMIELLRGRFDEEKSGEIARALTEGLWNHDQPISVTDAKGLGLDVNTEMPEEIMELMTLYQRPRLGAATVEYLRKRR